jgi:tRNA 2-thiouridine synthesizing protein A
MDGITIDTRGLACPLPVLKVRKAMKSIGSGMAVQILATDPGAEEDLRVYCDSTGCQFLSVDNSDGILTIVIRKN